MSGVGGRARFGKGKRRALGRGRPWGNEGKAQQAKDVPRWWSALASQGTGGDEGMRRRRRKLLVLARPCSRASSSATRAHALSAASSRTKRATAAFILTTSCGTSKRAREGGRQELRRGKMMIGRTPRARITRKRVKSATSFRTLLGRCGGSGKAARSRCRSASNELDARQGAVVTALNAPSMHSRPPSG